MLVPVWQSGTQGSSYTTSFSSSSHTSNLSHQQACRVLSGRYRWKFQICPRKSQSCLRRTCFPWNPGAECRISVPGDAGQVRVTPTSLGFSVVEGSTSLGYAFPPDHTSRPNGSISSLPFSPGWHLLGVDGCMGLVELHHMPEYDGDLTMSNSSAMFIAVTPVLISWGTRTGKKNCF